MPGLPEPISTEVTTLETWYGINVTKWTQLLPMGKRTGKKHGLCYFHTVEEGPNDSSRIPMF